MRAADEDARRRLARLYSILVMLLGLGILAATAMLGMVFGPRGLLNVNYLSFVILPALVALAVAVFIKRQQAWAMIAALLLAIYARVMFGGDALFLNIALTTAVVAFAALTVLCLRQPRAGGNSAAS